MLGKKAASFRFALKGIAIALKEEINFQIQLLCAFLALVLGFYFKISVTEWLFVLGASGLVLTAELLNTALEELCDMLKSSHDPHVGKIKDLAAGAVLVASIFATIAGLIIFIPKIIVL